MAVSAKVSLLWSIAIELASYSGEYYAVKVPVTWEEKTFVPQGSLVSMNCTADITKDLDVENSLEWSIKLPDRQIFDRFTTKPQMEILNSRDFYELPQIDIPIETIRLVINNTDGINGTVLRCANILSGELLQETTLSVYG